MNTFFKENCLGLVCGGIVFYLGLVRYYRYQHIQALRRQYPDPQSVLEDITIAREIHAATVQKEFPFLTLRGTELALFKTFSIPTISKLLVATGEFKSRCARRAEDTELLTLEMTEVFGRIQNQRLKCPYTSQADIDLQWTRAQTAVKRLNEIHGKYKIRNEDFIYTLSLFVFEPIAWVNQFGYRAMDPREINVYANQSIRYSVHNWQVAQPTIDHLLTRLPACMRHAFYGFVVKLLPTLIGQHDADALGLPRASRLLSFLYSVMMQGYAWMVRYLRLPRSFFMIRTPFYADLQGRFMPEYHAYPIVYQEGYRIVELGTKK
ncbi:uncharacterized protein B0P05DRAFT_571534 [Gilbertella persicaria]|uniref:uncharacterized protein n=1 Tax=Gilbertella persicaria TaxID=101096 RepID=UPI002220CDB7|nr:uncharacterized protein B0P05DRAFT_571534 [Gilbertella persicaria]KAI8079618.1 hypothetical protein B0P05DRAFT_571534 [Gilbertella persicaria]